MEKERSKGLSLRKRRGKGDKKPKPVIGAPRQIPMPAMPGARVGQVTTSVPAPQVRSRDKEKVADLVKRRMSTRFPVPGEQGDVPPMPSIPSMPSIPAGIGAKMPVQPRKGESKGPDIDLSQFREPAFDPEKFVATVLANSTDEEIKEFQWRLKEIRNRTSSDLQKNVFVNRTQFIVISKEIDKLKSEMRVLRGLLGELHTTTDSLKIEGSFGSTTNDVQARKHANRSSVADLTALHMSHLQALWKAVEGAQKFLPSVPGRHIVLESKHWVELNAATWKPRRIVHMVLLNDHLLIATVKKKRVDASSAPASSRTPNTKNVADKCWGLSEIDMVDLSSDATQSSRKSVSNAISLRVGKEAFVYQNESSVKKAELLRQFKKSRDELRKALRAETEDNLRRRDSVSFFAGRDPKLLEHGDLLNSLSAHGSGHSMFTVEGQSRNLRWVETQMDELDENIAHRKFEDAVSSVGKLRALAESLAKNNSLISELIHLKLDERASKLANIITANLVENPAQKTSVKSSIQWLVKLDYEDRAREAFLEARSATIKRRTRQVRFEGDVALYISQVALVQFTLIKNTVEIYNSCFEYRLASALVRWTKEHITTYIGLLDRQLATVEPNSKVYDDCMEITRIHSTMLVECGLDFQELRNPNARK
ncbi:Cullin repeat-like-containing domain protein [Tricharina praecox]|uniref:Cullin repeat-like-containing domain protein n=1 Tax=Tricharina praecox TaxID=43433 RepID=UPI00221FD551|nr:Cullin repeat-like-containing domain protein [Tricharina praecox]KAI5855838.1 Cullin repeat-like-containing domain protein [Tricharina praecox]